VLSQEEVFQILSSVSNIKHKSILIKNVSPREMAFPGQKDGMHIRTRTEQRIFEDAIKKVGIDKDLSFSVHSLRHSFATHLILRKWSRFNNEEFGY
jgi:site-specific recombinase XerD